MQISTPSLRTVLSLCHCRERSDRSNHERLLSQEVATDFAGARNDMRGQRFVYGRLTVSEACFYA
jgi:hypothetical protein